MKLTIRCGGIIRQGPERELIDDYLRRANGLASATGFHSIREQQVDLRKQTDRTSETRKLTESIANNMLCIALDETGQSITSRQIAKKICAIRDDGVPEIVFLIGGADGFDQSALPASTRKWRFGVQTWPHKLVRVMLAEQLYRALSIVAGSPYHRD